jgi:hypothetical protein
MLVIFLLLWQLMVNEIRMGLLEENVEKFVAKQAIQNNGEKQRFHFP